MLLPKKKMTSMKLRETETHYVVERNVHLPSAGRIPFKNIVINFGFDESEKRVKIREVYYPKADYTRADTKRLYKVLEDCPVCVIGRELGGSDTHSQKTFKPEAPRMDDRSGPSLVTGIFDPITKDQRISTVYGSELIASAAELPVDLVTSALGGKVVKFLLGLGLTFGSRRMSGRTKEEIQEIASHMLFRFIDPTPTQMAELKADLQKVRDALSFGSPMGAIKALFRPVALQNFGFGFGAGAPGLVETKMPVVAPTTLQVSPPPEITRLTGQMPVPVPVDIPGQFAGTLGPTQRVVLH